MLHIKTHSQLVRNKARQLLRTVLKVLEASQEDFIYDKKSL